MLRIIAKPSFLAAVAMLVGALAVAAAGCGGASESVEQDAKYWQQLTRLMKPLENGSLPDHRVFTLPGGPLIALHFDQVDLGEAENLDWLALGVPGVFCKADQERVEADLGAGFTHFHDLVNDADCG